MIARLHCAQFRSWAQLTLDLDGRPLALFGANGAGKTNILEALSMLAPGRGFRGVAAADQARVGIEAGWRIRAQIDDHSIDLSAAPSGARQLLIDEKPQPQTVLARLARVIWLTPAMDRLWTDSPETRRRFLDRVTLSLRPDHADYAVAYERAMRQRNRLLRDQVRDARWYEALEAQMAEAGAALTVNRLGALDRLMAAQAAGFDGFPAAKLALMAGEGHADDPDAGSIRARLADGRPRDMSAGRSLTGPHRADLGAVWGPADMPAALSSTGEQKALLLSLVLANARALADERPLLLLDEVAAHLDADRRAMLYAALSEMPAQSVLTGTGAELFERLDGRLLRVVREGATSRLEDRPDP